MDWARFLVFDGCIKDDRGLKPTRGYYSNVEASGNFSKDSNVIAVSELSVSIESESIVD